MQQREDTAVSWRRRWSACLSPLTETPLWFFTPKTILVATEIERRHELEEQTIWWKNPVVVDALSLVTNKHIKKETPAYRSVKSESTAALSQIPSHLKARFFVWSISCVELPPSTTTMPLNTPCNNNNNLLYAIASTYNLLPSWLSTTRGSCSVVMHGQEPTDPGASLMVSLVTVFGLLFVAEVVWISASWQRLSPPLLPRPRVLFFSFSESLSLHSSDWHWDQSAGCQTCSWCQDVPGSPEQASAGLLGPVRARGLQFLFCLSLSLCMKSGLLFFFYLIFCQDLFPLIGVIAGAISLL